VFDGKRVGHREVKRVKNPRDFKAAIAASMVAVLLSRCCLVSRADSKGRVEGKIAARGTGGCGDSSEGGRREGLRRRHSEGGGVV